MAIYEPTTTKRGLEAAHAFAAAPPARVTYTPVPFKLLAVAEVAGREVMARGQGDYEGVPFDPWKRGDLVALEVVLTYWVQGEGHKRCSTWHIARRASTPAANTAKYDFGNGAANTAHKGSKLFRIPYRYLHAAAALLGEAFETREALEAALDAPTQATAKAA